MENTLEFEFEGGGQLFLELLEGGELHIRLQAMHPSGSKITSTNVVIDQGKVQAIKNWLTKGDLK